MLDWFNKFGIGITVFCTFIIILFRIKNDIIYKTARAMGKGKLMDLLLKLNRIVQRFSLDDADKFLEKFEAEYLLKMDMQEGMVDLRELLTMKKTLSDPKVNDVLKEYRRKQEFGVLKNRKRWNEIRRDPQVDEALEAILDSLVATIRIKAIAAREKGNVGQVEALIKAIKSDENMARNREKRKELETYNEKLRAQEKNVDLKRIKEELFEIFKR